MKEEMSSLDIAVAAVELDRILKGFRIDNIYQLNPKTLLLKLRGREGAQTNLISEAGKRVHTTSYVHETPPKPSAFCMALRKYLRNGVVEKVQQYGFERIIEVIAAHKGGEHNLIVELFGGGNIILIDPESKVLHALSYRRMKDRNILRGEAYVCPPSGGEDPRSLLREDLYSLRSYGQLEVVRAAARFLSMGGTYAEEVLLRAGVPKNTVCSSLGDKDLDAIFSSLRELLYEVSLENEKPCIFVDENGNWIDVAPVQLKQYAHLKHVRFQTFNEALDEYYAKASVGEKVSGVRELAEQEEARLNRMLQDQEEKLSDSKRKAEAYRKIGDLVYRHLNEVQLLIQRVMEDKRSGKSWIEISEILEKEKSGSLVPAVYFEAFKPKTLRVQVSVEGGGFDLDLRLSAQKNAAEYYIEAKKAERKIRGVERAIKETKARIERSRLQAAERVQKTSKVPAKKEKPEWYEKFRWFRSSDGFLVIGGRDASTNEVLIKRHMEPQDVVFHADISGAPFVLIKTKGEEPPEQTVKEAAQFAASYSRAWKEGLAAVDVYWVSPGQVSKTPPSGEYLPRGSFMISGTRNYVKGVPLEVAVGIKAEGDMLRVVGGTTDAVLSQTRLSVRLVPGREPSGKLAKQIRSRLAQSASGDERKTVLKTPLEVIQRLIPAGRGAIK